jgi:hypothetical protein
MKRINIKFLWLSLLVFTIAACEKENTEGGENVDFPDVSGYASSDEVAADALIAHFNFDDNVNDSKNNVTGGAGTNVSYVPGKLGQAYKGSPGAFIAYENPGPIANLTSFSVAMWINKSMHQGGAESIFMLPNTKGFWGNFFTLIEGGTEDRMQLKVHFQKHTTPAITRWEQWVDLGGDNRLTNMYNQWKHVAFSYDETTSKFELYVNGSKINLPADFTDRKTDGPPAGQPLGPLAFADVSKFIIGGYQAHLGAPWGNPDGWMMNYTGALDELRFFDRPLTTVEVDALYRLQNQGR